VSQTGTLLRSSKKKYEKVIPIEGFRKIKHVTGRIAVFCFSVV
jgi:hypothetical protein